MKVLVIGAGNMGLAYADAIAQSDLLKTGDMLIYDKDPEKLKELRKIKHFSVQDELATCTLEADIIFLAVEPYYAENLYDELKPFLQEDQIIISIMAGVSIQAMQDGLGLEKVVLAMPNLPAQVGKGLTTFTAAKEVSRLELSTVESILDTTGRSIKLDNENDIDASTGISGSGPAKCAVLISGRGNNFAYIAHDANLEKSLAVILNAKTHKISACNALDKILIDKNHSNFHTLLEGISSSLKSAGVSLMADEYSISKMKDAQPIDSESIWYEEFLAMRAVIATVDSQEEATDMINRFSGGHSVSILTEDTTAAQAFMEEVDAAAVYHNASTRFTDGGAMGVGAELAISTDKLHHRGPLGLPQLVTNKYYVYGNGQIRK